MNFPNPVIQTLHEHRGRDAIAHVERIELTLIFDRILHRHRFHPTIDFLPIDFRDVPLRIERDDHAVEFVFFYRRVRRRLCFTRGQRQHEQ